MSSLYILDSRLLPYKFANIFSHSVGYSLTLLIVSFNAQKFLILMKPTLSVFSFVTYAFGVTSKKPLPNSFSQRFTPMFSSSIFIVFSPIFRYLIHWQLIFAYGVS